MPVSWQYPRLQRILMQITFWLALAVTTAAAALLSHQRQRALTGGYTRWITVGAVTLKLPRGWAIERSTGDASNVVLLARETTAGDSADPDATGRSLLVRLCPNDEGTASPIEFLRRSGILNGTLQINDADPQAGDSPDPPTASPPEQLGTCSIAGTSGNLVKVYRLQGTESEGTSPTAYAQWVACALVSGRRALVMQLDCPTTDPENAGGPVMASLAAAVRVAPEPSMRERPSDGRS